MSRERNDRGQFTEAVTLDDVLGVFEHVDGPAVTSGDVAEQTDCSRDTARRKLEELASRDLVASRQSAGRTIYWRRRTDEGADDRQGRSDLDDGEPNPVDPSDPIFSDRPTFASGRGDLSERVDDVLYGRDG